MARPTPRRLLIGLYSPAPQTGKTTVAGMIADALDEAAIISFAYPVKLATAAVLEQMGLSDVEATRLVFEDKDTRIPQLGGRCARDFLVLIGTGVGRDFAGQDVWVKANERMCGEENAYTILIDDVRHLNEVASIKRRGGYIIRVTNPRTPPAPTSNPTEANLEGVDFDFHIVNDGGIPSLRKKVAAIVKQLQPEGLTDD